MAKDKGRKDPSVKEADEAASQLKQADDLKKAIVEEALLMESGASVSVQQLFAYARQLRKRMPDKKEDKK